MVEVTEGHVLLAARPIIGKAPLKMRDFVTLFGVSPKVCAYVYTFTFFDTGIKVVHFLWALLFLKTYMKEASLIAMVGGSVDKKTFRKYVWQVLSKMSSKSRDIVSPHLCCCTLSLHFDGFGSNFFQAHFSLSLIAS
jgi:hypothetical protein